MSVTGLPGSAVPPAGIAPTEFEIFDDGTRNSRGTVSFADMLREAEKRSLTEGTQALASEPKFEALDAEMGEAAPTANSLGNPGSARRHFSTEVTIGENAVAFAARPIVAPAAIPNFTEFAVSDWPTEPVASPALQDRLSVLANAFDQVILVRPGQEPASFSLKELSGQSGIVSPAGRTNAKTSPHSPVAARPALPVVAPPVAARVGQAAAAPTKGTEPASRPSPVQQLIYQQSNGPVFALLIAGQSEYRLMIRGQRISEPERDQLIQDMHLTLARLGLPLQPVRVMMPENEA